MEQGGAYKKHQQKDIYGRSVASEKEFAILKGAPKLASAEGMAVRHKPFGMQLRNVRCIKCGGWVRRVFETSDLCRRRGPCLRNARPDR
eukprot:scaffold3820_cov415-Prasinococcus_capsulatus_cf.AAC.9